jgi:plastocyanin
MRLQSIVVLLALLGTACSSQSTAGNAPPSLTTGPQAWQLFAGASSQAEALQALDYYPNTITINAGDFVTWTNPTAIPHTVSIPPSGKMPPPGPPQNPAGGNTFDGTTYISSGFFLLGKTYLVQFTKPGTYKVYCLVHQPEMVGTIVVQPAGSPRPMTQAQYTALGQQDMTVDLNAAAASILTFPFAPGGAHLAAGISPGGPPSQSTVIRFLDGPNTASTVTVPVGTTLTWSNVSDVPHTVTFPIVGQPPPPGQPDQVPPSGGPTYDGTVLTNSGVMPPKSTYSLKFIKAGIYKYYCLFHDGPAGMIGTVTVQ